jgi:NTF2-like N-terminal transpeptidase domain
LPKTAACRGLSRLLAIIATVTLVLAACGDRAQDRLNDTLHAFADAVSRGDGSAAAAVTSDPAQASDTLGKLFDSLGKDVHVEVASVDRKDNDATFSLAATWKFGKDGRNQWTYTTTGNATASGDDWKVQWNPCLVHLKIARDVPRLLEFAILVWTIPAPVVQIHIAIPATDASGRVERLHHSANSLKRARRLSF